MVLKKISSEVFHHSCWKLDWGSTSFKLLGIKFSVDLDKITSLNYDHQIPKVFSLIEQWKRRKLTPIGRITVVKSITIPKLNHLFISLPNSKQAVVHHLSKKLFEFIWKSRCDKVKREIVTITF